MSAQAIFTPVKSILDRIFYLIFFLLWAAPISLVSKCSKYKNESS